MSPPAAEIAPTATPHASDRRRSERDPSENAHWTMATAAKAKASTAAAVWAKSCQVNSGLPGTGTGHPAVQVTCESTRKKAHETQIDTAGAQSASHRTQARSRRPAQATSDPPATISSRNTSNPCAVGMPGAPRALT